MKPLEPLLPGETRSEYLDRLERAEQRVAQNVIARLFELPVKDMGGGLRIVSLGSSWLPVEERDLIVRAVREFAAARCGHPWAHQDANGYPTCAACGADWTNVLHPERT